MSCIHRLTGGILAAAVLGASAGPIVAVSIAKADSQPISHTIQTARNGCPVPGTGTVRPCFAPPFTTYETAGLV